MMIDEAIASSQRLALTTQYDIQELRKSTTTVLTAASKQDHSSSYRQTRPRSSTSLKAHTLPPQHLPALHRKTDIAS
jgi:hypothetical protein